MSNTQYKDGVSVGNRPVTSEWQETSGLCRAQKSANAGHLWMQSDGSVNKIFSFRTSDGATRGAWTLSGETPSDLEDLASATIGGQPYIYLADTGDNANARSTFVIYRIKEPTITGSDGTLTLSTDFEKITCEFPGGDVPSHKDVETLLVDPATGDMYVLTKRITPAKCYKLAHASSYSGTQTLTAEGTITTPAFSNNCDGSGTGGYIVGGDINAAGTEIVIKNYTNVYTLTRNPGTQTVYQALGGTLDDVPAYVGGGRPSSHPNNEPQGEGVCYDASNNLYTASEFSTTFGSTSTTYPVFFYERIPVSATEISAQEGVSSYAGTSDTYIWSNPANQGDNRGAEATFIADYDSSTSERYGLLKFDLSSFSIPADATIVGVDLYLNINTEGAVFEVYKMLTAWTESSTWTSLSAPTNPFNGSFAAAAIETGVVHGDYATLTGPIHLKMPPSTVQSWINGSLTNNGWIFHNVGTGGNGFQFTSSEGVTTSQRPKLIVRYIPGVHGTAAVTKSATTCTGTGSFVPRYTGTAAVTTQAAVTAGTANSYPPEALPMLPSWYLRFERASRMYRRQSGQKIAMFAFNTETLLPVADDTGNITVYLSVNDAASEELFNPIGAQLDPIKAPGVYLFNLTENETDGDVLRFTGDSFTPNVQLVPREIYPFWASPIDGTPAASITQINHDEVPGVNLAACFNSNTTGFIKAHLMGRILGGNDNDDVPDGPYTSTGVLALNEEGELVASQLGLFANGTDLATLLSRLTSARALKLDNLNATVDSRLAPATAGRTLEVGTDNAAKANVASINGSANAAVNSAVFWASARTGTVQASPSPTTTIFDTDLTSNQDDTYWKDQAIQFTSGANAGLVRFISAYDGTSTVGKITIQPALPVAPTAGDTFIILGRR